jgi:hypothetical protein
MLALFVFLAVSLDPSNISDAKIALRRIQLVRANLTRHLADLTRFAKHFGILAENDKKIKAKIKFLQNARKIQPHSFRLTEVPFDPPQSGTLYVAAIPSSFSRLLLRSSPDLEFIPRKEIPVKKIVFEPPPQISCLVTNFSISFRLREGGTLDFKGLTLGPEQIRGGIEYPINIMFQQMTIKPSANRGNETHNCFPGFRLYGMI